MSCTLRALSDPCLQGRTNLPLISPWFEFWGDLSAYVFTASPHLDNRVLQSILRRRFVAWRDTAANVVAERDLILRFRRSSARRTMSACLCAWRAAHTARAEREAAAEVYGQAVERGKLQQVVATWRHAARSSTHAQRAADELQQAALLRQLRDCLRAWHHWAACMAALRVEAATASQQLRLRHAAVVMDGWQRAATEGRRDREANAAAVAFAARRCLLRSLRPWAEMARDERRMR